MSTPEQVFLSNLSHRVTNRLNSPAKPSLLESLPREFRDKILKLVLNPSAVIFVDGYASSRLTNHQDDFPVEKWRRERYTKRLVAHYDTTPPDNPNNKNTDSEPPICENIEYKSYARYRQLLIVNKKIYEESKSILLDFENTLKSGISNNVFQENAQPEFTRLVASNKVYFNCHSYEIYAFLESCPANGLQNSKSIVLGQRIVSDFWATSKFSYYYSTTVAVPPAYPYPWSSPSEPADSSVYHMNKENHDKSYNYYKYEMSRIMQLLDCRLPNLKEVALWAPNGSEEATHYYQVVVSNFCRMLAAGRIDVVIPCINGIAISRPSRWRPSSTLTHSSKRAW
jgi:hypothetical protein